LIFKEYHDIFVTDIGDILGRDGRQSLTNSKDCDLCCIPMINKFYNK